MQPVLMAGDAFLDNLLTVHGVNLAIGIVVLLAGFPVTRWFAGWVVAQWSKKGLDPSLHHFLRAIILWSLRIAILVVAAAQAGFEVTAFVAMLGGFAFAVGLALQGHLSNFAGGILIIVLRPFRVGDVVETQGHTGKVAEIHVFNTYLKTADNRTVILPNGPLSNGTVVNLTQEKSRRVEVALGIAYGASVEEARRALLAVMTADVRVLKDPVPEVLVTALGDSSVNLLLRCWTPTPDYWPVHFALQEGAKRALDGAGIEIPFPQRVVHMVPAAEA